jgi:hypothetical protein
MVVAAAAAIMTTQIIMRTREAVAAAEARTAEMMTPNDEGIKRV